VTTRTAAIDEGRVVCCHPFRPEASLLARGLVRNASNRSHRCPGVARLKTPTVCVPAGSQVCQTTTRFLVVAAWVSIVVR
jgi:hypothetical protein